MIGAAIEVSVGEVHAHDIVRPSAFGEVAAVSVRSTRPSPPSEVGFSWQEGGAA